MSSKVAFETNQLIDSLGEDAAWKRYVTDKMVSAVNAGMETEIERKNA